MIKIRQLLRATLLVCLVTFIVSESTARNMMKNKEVTDGFATFVVGTVAYSPEAIGLTITKNPSNVSICSGSNTTFSVTASGASGIAYQWQVSTDAGGSFTNISNGGIYTNATTNTLTLTNATVLQNGFQYRCVASTSSLSASRPVKSLKANGLPAPITKTSTAAILTVNAPSTAIFTVSAQGSYTWHGVTYTQSINFAKFDTLNAAGCDSLTTLHLTITPDTAIWTGVSSDSWFDQANWSTGHVPEKTTSVIIPASAPNQPYLADDTKAKANNVFIESGATLTAESPIFIYGSLIDSGSLVEGNFNISRIILAGSGTLIGTDTFTNLEIDGDYSIGGAATDKVYITKRLIKSSGTFTTNNKLTLISNASGTALIEDDGGVLVGKVYVQHYADGNFGYHHFSSPVSDATVNSWSNAFPIFGPDGAPSWLSVWGSLQYYDEAANTTTLLDSSYYNYTALSNPLVPAQGYTAWLNSLPTLNTFGTPNNDAISIPVTHSAGTNDPKGWNFVGNPYPSPISWTALKELNPSLFGDASCYLWKASGKGTDGTWTAYDGKVGVNGAGDVINSSLGFFVYVNNSGTLNFDNSVRIYDYTSPEIFGTKSNANTLRLSIKDAISGTKDEAVAYTSYNEGFSRKMAQPSGATNATIAFDVKGTKAAINVLTSIDSKTELPIAVLTPKAGTYTLSLSTQNINLPVYLKDAVTGVYTDLKANSTATIRTTAKETVGRYSLVFSQPASFVNSQLSIYPNPAKSSVVINGSHIASVQVLDNLGRIVKVVSLKDATNPSLSVSGLAKGAYHLKVQTTDGKVNNINVVKE